MRVRIVATSSSLTPKQTLSWGVDIYTDGNLACSNITVEDPLDKKGKTLCRWYLNKYRQKEPYSTSKAKSAASLLQGYGSRLATQLQLAKYVDIKQPTVIEIEDGPTKRSKSNASLQQLYWEFLEDEGLWQPSATVSVHRVTLGASETPMHTTAAATPRSSKTTIRLLLIIARDLRREWTDDADISPRVVSDILWEVRSKLQASGSSTQLDIEIVRPGTFDALKRHLQARIDHGGHNYDIVHFDMHGTVTQNEDGLATGYLHFSDSESLKTKATPAIEVVQAFDGHSVSAVVFNACDSANSTLGDDGNIASVFAQHMRVTNVLAMAHRASENAIAKFLSLFYPELIVGGRDFTSAAKTARSALRVEPLRHARFHLHVPVIDWTIPVVYSSGSDSAILCEPTVVSNASLQPFSGTGPEVEIPVLGRDFDCLRLEKALLSKGLVFLHGAPGVGKSTLLRTLTSSWTRSNFLSRVYYVDFSSEKITSIPHFMRELLRQEESLHGTSWRPGSAASRTADRLDAFREHLMVHRVAYILDGLMDSGLVSRTLFAAELLQLLGDLRPASTARTWQTEKFVIVSGRAAPETIPLQAEKMPHSAYGLEGLESADAISLVQYLNPPETPTRTAQGGVDLSYAWKAEPIINLLQGNPAGLIHFIRLARESDVAFPELYQVLHSENIVQYLSLNRLHQRLPLFQEFMDLLTTLSNESYAIWTMLAWYWQVGPLEDAFADMLLETSIVTDKKLVSTAINEARRLGYLHREQDGEITRISPFFTIFMRIVICSSACRFRQSSLNPWLNFRRGFAFGTMKHLVPNGSFLGLLYSGASSGPKYAVRLMTTVLSSHWFRDQDDKYWKFLIRFFLATNKRCNQVWREALSKGVVHSEMGRVGSALKDNFLFIIKLCRGRGPLPLPCICWPMDMVLDVGFFVLQLYNTEQISVVADYYEQLLNGAITQSLLSGGGDAVQPEDLTGIIQLAAMLAEVHRRHVSAKESRSMKFIELGNSVIEASEKKFGVSSEPTVILAKSMLSLNAATILMDDRKPTESRAKLQEALKGFREMNQSSNVIAASRLEKFLSDKTEVQAAAYKSFFDSTSTREKKIEDVWNLALAETMGYDMNEVEVPQRAAFTVATHPLDEVWDIILRNHRKLTSTSHRLDQYENEIDRGHWARALGHHGAMMVQSMKKLDFDQVQEHLDAQESIVGQHGVGNEELSRIQATRESIDLMQDLVSIDPDHITPEQFERMDQVANNVEKFGFDAAPMRRITEIVLESLTKDKDDSLPHNQAPGILSSSGGSTQSYIISFMKLHGSRAAGSREYGSEILGVLATSLETLRSLENAEDRSSELDIYKCLEELTLLTQNTLYQDVINVSAIPKRRDWNTSRLIRDIVSEMKNLQKNTNIEEYTMQSRALVERCRTITALDGRKDKFDPIAEELEAMSETLHLTTWTQRATVALEEEKNKEKFLRVAREMLDLHKQGAFDRSLVKDYNKTAFNAVWLEFFHESISLATHEHKWTKAETIFLEWRSHAELWELSMEGSRGEAVVGLEYYTKEMASLSRFCIALRNLDMAGADSHLAKMKAISTENREQNRSGSGGILNYCELMRRGAIERLFSTGVHPAHQYVVSMILELQKAGLSFQT